MCSFVHQLKNLGLENISPDQIDVPQFWSVTAIIIRRPKSGPFEQAGHDDAISINRFLCFAHEKRRQSGPAFQADLKAAARKWLQDEGLPEDWITALMRFHGIY